MHVGAVNPNYVVSCKKAHGAKMMTWVGTVDEWVLPVYLLNGSVTAASYLEMLETVIWPAVRGSASNRQQTPRGILNGDGIHIHLYRIQMYHLVSGTETDVHTLVTDTWTGLNSRQWSLLCITASLASINVFFARPHLKFSRMSAVRENRMKQWVLVILCVAENNAFVQYQRHSNMRYKKRISNMPALVSGEYVSGCLLAVRWTWMHKMKEHMPKN